LQEDIRKRRLIESQLEQMNAGLEAMVTERTGKYLKEKQKAEAANQAKSIFLSNMSHELRTPLNAILGFSQLLVKDEAVTPQQEEYLRIIQHSGEHLLRLINDILDMSKIESGQIELKEETIDLKETVRELALMMKVRADAKRLRFVYECEEGIGPFVRIDAGKLSQILINLIGNAIKYTDKGGLSLRVRLDRCEKEQCILVFEVEDSGRGMSEGELKEVFKPFVQARSVSGLQEGTGLGLAITKRYVELMKGEIEVRSDVGKGTLFRLTLPAKVMEAGNMTRSTHALTVTGIAHAKRPYRILIVEDQRENRILLRKILFSAGFEVYEAVDGAEGVAKFKEVQPDFIWMDLRMPGMDGYEATRTIRTLPGGKEVGIAALTASAFVEQHEEVLAAGCDELVHKPYREEEIFEVMRRYLGLEYTYESRQKPAAALPPEAKALDALSDTLANDLHDALIALNREAVDAAVEEIKGVDATLYEAFHSLAENYAYETLLTLLEERKKQ
jgi:signal transduction histidine kinase/DNA-binding response OmpR family regulator